MFEAADGVDVGTVLSIEARGEKCGSAENSASRASMGRYS
jgi:hypothetical protein